MLQRKLKQSKQLHQLFPERKFILIGDNGQMDIDLGLVITAHCTQKKLMLIVVRQMLIKENLVEAVFIHDIYESSLAKSQPLMVIVDSDNEEEEAVVDEEPLGGLDVLSLTRQASAPPRIEEKRKERKKIYVQSSDNLRDLNGEEEKEKDSKHRRSASAEIKVKLGCFNASVIN